MTRTARIGLAAVLLLGGATITMAQNGPATGGYPPARWNPNFYGHYGSPHRHYAYYPRYYAYYPVYPAVAGWSQLVERQPRAAGTLTQRYDGQIDAAKQPVEF